MYFTAVEEEVEVEVGLYQYPHAVYGYSEEQRDKGDPRPTPPNIDAALRHSCSACAACSTVGHTTNGIHRSAAQRTTHRECFDRTARRGGEEAHGIEGGEGDAGAVVEAAVQLLHCQHVADLAVLVRLRRIKV